MNSFRFREALVVTHPALAAEADGWDPASVTAGSDRKLGWVCSRGHRWTASVGNRARGRGCPVCAGRALVVGENDLATSHPELSRQAHGWDPRQVLAGSAVRKDWICAAGHIWTTLVTVRTKNAAGCPACAGQRPIVGVTDLVTTHPGVAETAHGWDPTTAMAGTSARRPWRCSEGHVYEMPVKKRTSGQGCYYCSGHRVLMGFNDLATTHPSVAAEAYGWDPRSVSRSSGRKKPWICAEGHVFEQVVAMRTAQGCGCPTCATTGFRGELPAHLYLVQAQINGIQFVKFGITNSLVTRMRAHRKTGFAAVPEKVRRFELGHDARRLELDLLRMVNDSSARRPGDVGVRFAGYTEAYVLDDLSRDLHAAVLAKIDQAQSA